MKRNCLKLFAFSLLIGTLTLFCPLEVVAQSAALVDSGRMQRPLLPMTIGQDTHMNLLFNTSFAADRTEGERMYVSPRMHYLKWEMKGRIDDSFSFHFRQSLTKKSVPGEGDKAVHSIDYANISWQVNNRFSLMAGKQLLCLGGYEFWVSGYKVKAFSLFNDYMNNYATGVTVAYKADHHRTLSLQVVGSKVGSDEETFRYGRPEGVGKANVPLLSTLNYESFSPDESIQLRYSLSYGRQAAGRDLAYFTSGHVLRHRNWLAYWDVNASYEGVDHKGIVSGMLVRNEHELPETAQHVWYFSTVANADCRLSDHWNCFVKGIYECGGIARTNGLYARGVHLHEWQSQVCAEYYPKKKLDLKFYLLAQSRQRFATSASTRRGMESTFHQQLMLGLVYAIPVF